MTYQRRDVVWGEDPFRDGTNPRPWLVCSDTTHPFHGEEYACVLVSTTHREPAIPLRDADWVAGGSPVDSYASPWIVMSLKRDRVVEVQGRLTRDRTDRIATGACSYLRATGDG